MARSSKISIKGPFGGLTPRQIAMQLGMTPVRAGKGEFEGECNRTACNDKPATWYNHSTEKYYCWTCARAINDANRADAMRLFGHDLCTKKQP